MNRIQMVADAIALKVSLNSFRVVLFCISGSVVCATLLYSIKLTLRLICQTLSDIFVPASSRPTLPRPAKRWIRK